METDLTSQCHLERFALRAVRLRWTPAFAGVTGSARDCTESGRNDGTCAQDSSPGGLLR